MSEDNCKGKDLCGGYKEASYAAVKENVDTHDRILKKTELVLEGLKQRRKEYLASVELDVSQVCQSLIEALKGERWVERPECAEWMLLMFEIFEAKFEVVTNASAYERESFRGLAYMNHPFRGYMNDIIRSCKPVPSDYRRNEPQNTIELLEARFKDWKMIRRDVGVTETTN